jgi:hypothetical protein
MAICESTDYMFPMLCDVYYPITGQNLYGQIKKDWVYNKTIAIYVQPAGSVQDEEVKPKFLVEYENLLVGRVKSDIRISDIGVNDSITNVLITNIRTSGNSILYKETAGARTGRGTIYEISSQEPIVGAFGDVDHYQIILRRTENQGIDD